MGTAMKSAKQIVQHNTTIVSATLNWS